jgi:hypothetical protein
MEIITAEESECCQSFGQVEPLCAAADHVDESRLTS